MGNKGKIIYKESFNNGVHLSSNERKHKIQKLMASMIYNYLENTNKQNT